MRLQEVWRSGAAADPEEPTAATVAGLLDTGLPSRADSGTAVLADDIRYSLRLTNDDACTY
ncbi:hypothetical protein [Streptomyces sp. NBC_01435]|uniref:hypothetical protein n=1 Tax=Streptomyces sp. NBC_01435 TaxID=2903865 RepID=UPI002E3357F1|nr:hypothetical protein [Streptomyces sp. NBC_01435]